MSLNDLTQGAIAQMIQTADPANSVQNPVCQILSIKKIQASATSASNVGDRYRIILSDGLHYAQAMLASQKRSMVESGELEKHSIVRIAQYASNSVQNRRILILLDLEVIHKPTEDRLGSPTNVDDAIKGEGGVKQEGGANTLGNSNIVTTQQVEPLLLLPLPVLASSAVPVVLAEAAFTRVCPSIPSKVFLPTKIAGPSRLVSLRNPRSVTGPTSVARGSSSPSTFSTTRRDQSYWLQRCCRPPLPYPEGESRLPHLQGPRQHCQEAIQQLAERVRNHL